MRIEGEAVRTEAPVVAAGERQAIFVAQLLMDAAEDNGRTNGWYWMVEDPSAGDDQRSDIERWRDAVVNRQGPHRNAPDAISGVAFHSIKRTLLTARLEEASEAMASGALDAKIDTALAWLQEAHREDEQAEALIAERNGGAPSPEGTTATGNTGKRPAGNGRPAEGKPADDRQE